MSKISSQKPLKGLALSAIMLALAGVTSASAQAATPQYTLRVPVKGLVEQAKANTPPKPAPLGTLSFSTCGASGRYGPSLAQCQAAYANQPLILASLGMSGFAGYQEWTVPATGAYTITTAGAGGGQAPGVAKAAGGQGAIVRGTFNLTQGTVLQIVVGQPGIDAQMTSAGPTDAGGGGGTFVVAKTSSTPLLVAGGGGGGNSFTLGSDVAYGSGGNGGMSSTPVNPPAGASYRGASTYNWGEAGAGFSANSPLPQGNSAGFTIAYGFSNGAVGGFSNNGTTSNSANRYGGFGGGAGSHGYYCIGGGGGGGYQGGIGAIYCIGGGGGSSYISSSATGSASSTGLFNSVSLGTNALGWVPASTAGYVIISQ